MGRSCAGMTGLTARDAAAAVAMCLLRTEGQERVTSMAFTTQFSVSFSHWCALCFVDSFESVHGICAHHFVHWHLQIRLANSKAFATATKAGLRLDADPWHGWTRQHMSYLLKLLRCNT